MHVQNSQWKIVVDGIKCVWTDSDNIHSELVDILFTKLQEYKTNQDEDASDGCIELDNERDEVFDDQ
ncbi:hypothetical protein DPMN_048813 [Dreissena polymorpha]|uniref:Uncharacterized protein n=1 Tax=Dreissena polymorpha TaxID=45954 RepID=A0A9D4DCB3_DREPO|nr:hypothetical protein DPMN_048813 [Dreissena polymorpha]